MINNMIMKVKSMDPDEVFAYQTIKLVKIRDRRLGILHYALMLAIIGYILGYTIIYQQRYLRSEPPYGSIRATVQQPDAWAPAEKLPYCTQNRTSYAGYPNLECVYLMGFDLTFPPAVVDSIMVSTRIKDTFYPISSPNCSSLPNTMNCAPNLTAYAPSTRYYTAGVENYTIYMEHSIFGRQNNIMLTNDNCTGTLYFKNGSKMEFKDPNRGGDIITIETLLAAADVSSLDMLSQVSDGQTLRYDGTLIIAVVEYGNEVLHSDTLWYSYSMYHIPGVNVLAQQPASVVEGGIQQRSWYGVRTIFLVVGTIGHFDFPTLLTSFVNGIALAKVSTVLVDMMLLYVLPDKSIYAQHKFEVTEDFNDLRAQRKLEKQMGDY